MPRKGKGQKIQAASGQQYGQAKAQEDAQREIPLPAMNQLSAAPRPRPGEQTFNRPSERPQQSIMATNDMAPAVVAGPDKNQMMKALALIPVLEAMASLPDASPHLRNTTRRVKAFIGDVSELISPPDEEQ